MSGERVPLRVVPPLPSAIVEGDGVPTVERFGELVAEFADTGRTGWSPPSVMVAEWTARRLVEARALIAQKAEERAVWVAQIDEWYSSVTGEAQLIVAFAEAALKAHALRHREETKRATLKLPSMIVRTKSNPARIVVEDADAFVEWAKVSDPDALRVKYEPILDVVKGYRDVIVTVSDGDETFEEVVIVDADGEVVPGLGWKAETITASV